MNKNFLKYFITTLVIAFIGYIFATRLSSSWDSISQTIDLRPNYLSILAVVSFAIAVVVSGLLWRLVLTEVNTNKEVKHISRLDGVRVHLGAWLLKYIPGQVGSVVYKVSWGSKKGFKKSDVTMSFVYENLFLTIVSLLPTSIILLLIGNLNPGINFVLIGTFAGSLILLFSHPMMKRFISFNSKRFKINSDKLSLIETNRIVTFTAIYGLPRLINGLGFVLVAASIMTISAGDVLPLIAAYTLAGIIGIYAIFVPSGLGVRESMVAIFAAGVIGVNEAILLALVARFYATITDGILAIIYSVLTGREKRFKV